MIVRICLALLITLMTFSSAHAWPSPVWKTGQTLTQWAGDDGELRKGVEWPSPRFTVDGECVTDNLTGLMWSVDANPTGGTSWQGAFDYADSLTLCGHSDWRVPNRKEMMSLVDRSQFTPALPADHPFTNVVASGYYWTSTTCAYYPGYTWYIRMQSGEEERGAKGNSWPVWPVRGGGPFRVKIGLTPLSGAAGTVFTQKGMGFTPGGTATLHVRQSDGAEFPTVTLPLSSHGRFVATRATPTDLPAGNYTWWSVDDATGMKTDEMTFRIEPQQTYPLTVVKSGLGKGTVTGPSAGISCGDTCSAQLAPGTQVVLTAKADAAHEFIGWTGACFGTDDCTVTVDAGTTVGAMFQDRTKSVEHVVLLVVDGLRPDYFYSMLDENWGGGESSEYPFMRSLFRDAPYFRIDKCMSTFPTAAYSDNASLVTGSYPAKHGIQGDAWCDRTTQVCRDYAGSDEIKVFQQGIATADLDSAATTVYDLLAEKGLSSQITFHMYSGKNTAGKIVWTAPEPADNAEVVRNAEKRDNNMIYEALTQIKKRGLPNLLTLHFAGHDYAVRKNGKDDSFEYVQQAIDPLLGILIEGGELERYGSTVAERMRFPGLISGFAEQLAKTVFVITSGHGASSIVDDGKHMIRVSDIREALEGAGFDADNTWISTNGGMAHIYIRNRATANWADYPQSSDIALAYAALSNQRETLGIDRVLARDSKKTGGWTASYKSNPKALPAEDGKRVSKLASVRSGDIILIPGAGYEFGSTLHKSGHGGLSKEDSLVPLVFSGTPLGYNQKVVKTANITVCDVAPTISALLGIQMTNADGKAISEVVKASAAMEDISVSPKALSFGNVARTKSATRKITITNKGKKNLSIDKVAVGGTHASDFAVPGATDTCTGQSIAPRRTCTVSVVFTPGDEGKRSAAIEISSSDPDAPSTIVSAAGTGT